MVKTVVGVDPSMRSTGIVTLRPGWLRPDRTIDWNCVDWDLVETDGKQLSAPAAWELIAGRVEKSIIRDDVRDVGIESPAYAARNGSNLIRLAGVIEHRVWTTDACEHRITRSAHYKLTLGVGNAAKSFMAQFWQELGAPWGDQGDLADAASIANYLCANLDQPFVSIVS